jgi:hypothetical protein
VQTEMDERRLRHDGTLKIRGVILALPEAQFFLIVTDRMPPL